EQRKIAAILGTWDAAIATVEQLIAALRERKKGLMQRLLTGAVRFPEFERPVPNKKTEYGEIPEDWSYRRLADVCIDIQTGPFGNLLHEEDYVEANGTPIITVEHLADGGIIHTNLPLVSNEDRVRLAKFALRTGDIVFSRVGAVDRNALVTEQEDGWLFS